MPNFAVEELLVEAVKQLLEVIVDTTVIEMQVQPGPAMDKNIILLTVYERGKSIGSRGYGTKGKGDEGEEGKWHQVSGKRPDVEFLDWLLRVLEGDESVFEGGGTNYHPSQPIKTPLKGVPGVKDEHRIIIDRLMQNTSEMRGHTDEEIFDQVLKNAKKEGWFRISGDPDIGVWDMVVQIDEPGYVEEPEKVKGEHEAATQIAKEAAVREFWSLISQIKDRINVKRRRGEPMAEDALIAIAVGNLLSDRGFASPFDISAVNVEEAQRAVAETEKLARESDLGELEPYLRLLEPMEEWVSLRKTI